MFPENMRVTTVKGEKMNRNEARAKFVSWANAQVGTREGANNYNRYADVEGIARLYGWNPQNQPWCDIFFDAGMIECFGFDLASAMTYQFTGCAGAACAMSASYYRSKGAFFQSPEIGDQIFFYSGGGINHTGVVTAVNGGSVTTVEGNSSDMVARRNYSLGDSSIAGYGRPNWVLAESAGKSGADSAGMAESPAPAASQSPRVLRYGMTGDDVKELQELLIQAGEDVGSDGADGIFGRNTRDAVIRFQKKNGLTVDGEAWTETLGSLRKAAKGSGAENPATTGKTYTVKAGDTLTGIAESVCGDIGLLAELMSVNGIEPPAVTPGQTLKLP